MTRRGPAPARSATRRPSSWRRAASASRSAASRCSTASTSRCAGARSTGSSARTARASRPWSRSSTAPTRRTTARSRSTACPLRRAGPASRAGAASRWCSRSSASSRPMPVGQNILLSREPTGRLGLIDDREIAPPGDGRAGPGRAPTSTRTAWSRSCPVGSRQLVEIAKAISQDASILILDEPTASLAAAEIQTLMEAIRRLTAEGISVIYISHHLDEVMAICDHVTVLRDGDVTLVARRPPRRHPRRRSSRACSAGRSRAPSPTRRTTSTGPGRRSCGSSGLAQRPPARTSRSSSTGARSSASRASWAAAGASSCAPSSASTGSTRARSRSTGRAVAASRSPGDALDAGHRAGARGPRHGPAWCASTRSATTS